VNDRIARWDARYARGEDLHDWQPSPLLAEALLYAAPGHALDLACGAGRHALFLAERGWTVEAVDGSAVALRLLRDEARTRGIRARIRTRRVDLEARPAVYAPQPSGYDLVCDFYYLYRDLWIRLRDAVRPRGLFVAAIHVGPLEDPEKPDFLVRPGELAALVGAWGWEILRYGEGATRETGHRHSTAELVARRPDGVRGGQPDPRDRC
jgi:SAM-dependent methyltransferase